MKQLFLLLGIMMLFQSISYAQTCDVDQPASQVVCAGSTTTGVNFTGSQTGTVYSWTNNNTNIGLAASGTGNIPGFTATNTGSTPQIATITVTPSTFQTFTQTFSYTGAAQTWTVPAGVTKVQVEVYGAQGGSPFSGAGQPGKGGRTVATLDVTPGEMLQINVGGRGAASSSGGSGGFNGGGAGSTGGGGGGASDVRWDMNNNSTYSLDERLIVAGGGGGAGSAGSGGVGGGTTGGGGGGAGFPFGGGGGGGTQSTGGSGGDGGGAGAGTAGHPGSLGTGGAAGGTFGAGGGGGGYYGGGGAGAYANIGGGGGGGSSYVSATLGSNVTNNQGFQSGDGQVIISYSVLVCTGTPKSFTIQVSNASTWYLDADGDGYYTGSGISSCSSPGAGYTTIVIAGGDCNDDNAAINPGATEVCNGIDDNCDGQIDEGTSISPTIVASGPTSFCMGGSVGLAASLGNNAIQLDGLSQYVITPELKSHFPTNSLTIELWFKASSDGVIVSEVGQPTINAGWHDSQIELLADGHVKVRVWQLDAVDLGTVTLGTWNHAVVRYNAATGILDGVLNGTPSAGSSNNSPRGVPGAQYWAFGAQDGTHLGSGKYFAGQIDEIRIWNTAISNAQIAANYDKSIATNAAGLVAYYKADETTGSTANDATANALHSTLINSPIWVIPSGNALNTPTYAWSTTATTPSITVSTTGIYSVQTTISPACTATSPTVNVVVTDSIVYVDSSKAAGGNGASWANAYKYLQDALAAAQANSCIKQVWVAKGTYTPTTGTDQSASFYMVPNVKVYGGFPNDGTGTMANRNWTANPTILSGDLNGDDVITGSGPSLSITNNGENSMTVLTYTASGTPGMTRLDGFTITGGNASSGGGGGGMINNSASFLDINDVIFRGNAGSNGAGIYLAYTDVTVSNAVFSQNMSSGEGGGMYVQAGILSLTNVVFTGNKAGFGGGLLDKTGASTLTNVAFAGNDANFGGGMFVNSVSNLPTITNATFADNTANYGAGIYNSTSDYNIKNGIFWGNKKAGSATAAGADIENSGCQTTLSNSLLQLTNNTTNYPSAGFIFGTGNLFAQDPVLVNVASDNLRLQSCSPAINAGANSANNTTTDLDGNDRIYNSGTIDMGAYEYQGAPDATPPTLTTPSPLIVRVTAPAGSCMAAVNLPTPSANDNCSSVTVTSDHPSTTYPLGITRVFWTATDARGNATLDSQFVYVTPTLPIIRAYADANSCNATDVNIGAFLSNCSDFTISNDHPSTTYPTGTTKVTWTVTTPAGKTLTYVQQVVVYDNQAPSFGTVDIVRRNADVGSCSTNITLTPPNATDNCGTTTVTNDHPSTSFNVGWTYVKWTATDASGNKKSVLQPVVVYDNQAPVFGTIPVVRRNADFNTCNATIVLDTPGVSDNCGIKKITKNYSSNVFPLGWTYVTWTAEDIYGNKKTAVQPVVVYPVKGCTSVLLTSARKAPAEAITETDGAHVYPNPTTGRFTLQLENLKTSKGEVSIIAANGKTIYKQAVELFAGKQSLQFNIGANVPGMYLLRVVSGEGVKTLKVVLE